MKMTKYLLKSSITGALGGLLFGFDTAVIAGTTQQLTAVYHLTSFTLGLTVAIGLVGTVVGAMSAGVVGQRIGGREALRILAVLYTISALGCALAWNWPALMVFRFIGGLGVGGSSVLGPVYIAELAPAKWRGRLVGLFQINIVIGILLFGFLFAFPNFVPDRVRGVMPGWLPKSTINLGLDLQGGSYLLLEVDMPGVVKERMETMRGDIRASLRRARINYTGLDAARESVNIHITDLSQLDAARKILRDIASPSGPPNVSSTCTVTEAKASV